MTVSTCKNLPFSIILFLFFLLFLPCLCHNCDIIIVSNLCHIIIVFFFLILSITFSSSSLLQQECPRGSKPRQLPTTKHFDNSPIILIAAHQKSQKTSKLQVSFGTRSKECRKSLWKLALNNNNNNHHHHHHDPAFGGFSSPDVTIVHNGIHHHCDWTPLDSLSSDHRPILTTLHLPSQQRKGPKRLVWNWKKGNISAYTADLEERLSQNSSDENASITSAYEYFAPPSLPPQNLTSVSKP